LHPRDVNATLAAFRPLLTEVLWDRDDRTVGVTLGTGWSTMTAPTIAVASRRRRGSQGHHTSDYNAPWRARASHPDAKPRI
ncbi:MAG TPA: hypothetical protein VLV45_08930, partial [Gemmatimonadales bacterium]|nr:hypothetical protein [Gemmatimonadales bacterium]